MNASRLVTPRHCGMRLREAKQREGLALRDDCLSSGHPVRPTQGTVMMNRRTLLSSAAGMAAAAALPEAASAAPGERAVVIFFSSRGENYAPGGVEHLDVGHTERVARRIAERTGADLFAIEPAEPYPENYRATTEVAERELSANARRPMKAPAPDLSQYGVVYLGHPIWWSRIPPVVETLLDAVDLSGKTVAHFCTHEGSGFGSSDRALRSRFPKAKFVESFSLVGHEAPAGEARVDAWLGRLGAL